CGPHLAVGWISSAAGIFSIAGDTLPPGRLFIPVRPVVARFIGGIKPRGLGVKRLGATFQFERHGQTAATGNFFTWRNRFFFLAFFTTVRFSLHCSPSLTITQLYPALTNNTSCLEKNSTRCTVNGRRQKKAKGKRQKVKVRKDNFRS
ncbi:MAG TPA: hypothetical protein VLQ89_01845, partial [Candidatus Binatia bacterium]|nr:hypothetical protein [Candidatus Binatia bacterium]